MSTLPFDLKEKLTSLESAILSRHPGMPGLLADIHRALRAQPENVTLMSPEEIGIVVQGLKIHTGVELAGSLTKSAGKSSTSLAKKIAASGIDAF